MVSSLPNREGENKSPMEIFINSVFMRIINHDSTMNEFIKNCRINIHTDLQLFGHQLDMINNGECDVETKWRFIENIEERAFNIFPNLVDLLDRDDVEDISYRYYLMLNDIHKNTNNPDIHHS